jgi:hypothetical protein
MAPRMKLIHFGCNVSPTSSSMLLCIAYMGSDKVRSRCAERIAHQLLRAHRTNWQNATDLAREAVGCMGLFGRWLLVPFCRPHDCTTPRTLPPGTTGVRWNHTPHTITFLTTGNRHNWPLYHAGITGTGTLQPGTTKVQESRLIRGESGLPTTLPSGRTDCASPAPR